MAFRRYASTDHGSRLYGREVKMPRDYALEQRREKRRRSAGVPARSGMGVPSGAGVPAREKTSGTAIPAREQQTLRFVT